MKIANATLLLLLKFWHLQRDLRSYGWKKKIDLKGKQDVNNCK